MPYKGQQIFLPGAVQAGVELAELICFTNITPHTPFAKCCAFAMCSWYYMVILEGDRILVLSTFSQIHND